MTKTPRSRLMWAVMRDGEIDEVRHIKRHALYLAHAGKQTASADHKFSVCRVRVTPIKKQERRR